MSKPFTGNVTFPLNFNVEKTAPLDDRLVVSEKSNLWDGTLGDYVYVGMVVNVQGGSSLYVLTELPSTVETNWSEIKSASDVSSEITGVQTVLENVIEGIQSRIDTDETKHSQDIAGVQTQLTTGLQSLKVDILGDELTTTFDTLKQVQDWADEHGEQAANLITQVNGIQNNVIPGVQTQLTTSISGVQGELYGIQSKLLGDIDSLEKKHDDEISGVQGRITKEVSDLNKSISDLTTKHNTDLNSAIEGLQSEINSVKESGNQAIEELTELHKTDVVGLQTVITELENQHDEDIKGVQGQLKTAIDTLLDDKGASEKLDSFKEVADWINTHETDFENLQTLTNNGIQGVQGELYGVQSKLLKSISDLEQSVNEDISKQIEDLETQHDEDIKGVQGQVDDSLIYHTAAEEGWSTVAVGGIASGTSYTQFTGVNQKTICQVLDDILFPTYDNKVTAQPSAGNISITPILFEVGVDTIPAESKISKSANSRGTLQYNTTEKNNSYAGNVSYDVLTLAGGEWGGTLEEKTYTVTRTVKFEAGAKPLNNKGQDDGKLAAFSNVNGTYTKTCTFTGVYPIYINNSNISSVSKVALANYTGSGGVAFTMNIPAETEDNKWEVHIPNHLTISAMNQYDPTTKDYTASTTLVKNGTTEHNGITYQIYVRTLISTDKQGASQYKIVVKK